MSLAVDEPLEISTKLQTCDCSYCQKRGIIWAPVKAADITVLNGAALEVDLEGYKFASESMEHMVSPTRSHKMPILWHSLTLPVPQELSYVWDLSSLFSDFQGHALGR